MTESPQFHVRLADGPQDVQAAQHLRYRVFVEELKGDGAGVDHALGLEADHFDSFCDHMLLLDLSRGATVKEQVVGVYRLMGRDKAKAAGGFYSSDEFDLQQLLDSGRKLLELGRSCIAPEYRGGAAMFHLWQGLAAYAVARNVEILFGTASFHGTDIQDHAEALSFLHHNYLAPPDLRVRTRHEVLKPSDLHAPDKINRVAATRAIPPLIKAYLKLGGFVGGGAYVDTAFNTTDVCLILDVARMSERQKAMYFRDPL